MFDIFPQGLEGTLIIPIFVGLIVMAALTEAWGWDFVGVVVPGYLASVFLFQPVVAAIVVIEAIATWALAVALNRGLTAAGVIYPVFGRDRFYLILVASVVVRITLEGVILPALVLHAGMRLPALHEHRHELFGIGLVLAPLCANRFWNPGIARGLFQLAAQTIVVIAVLRLVLMPFTNFSLAGFDPSYDPLALAFLTSPRAQMALLVTAALASWFNRRYGWDFHGILIPALLGLTALSPIRLVATVIEAVLIMIISHALLRLPPLRRANVEGVRRVLLCFSVGVVLKMVVARTALAHLPGYRPTDLLGFGYLLPSLLAERIWRAKSVVVVLLPTLQTAALGFFLTTAAALGLAVAAPLPSPPPLQFATLPQALLSLSPRLRAGGEWGGALNLARLQGGHATPFAQTADGYRVFAGAMPINNDGDDRTERTGVVAIKAGARAAVFAPFDEWAGVAAAAAARDGATLVLGAASRTSEVARALGVRPRAAPPVAVPNFPRERDEGWENLVRQGLASNPTIPPNTEGVEESVEVLRPLVAGAGVQIDRARSSRELARAVAPYGLASTATIDGAEVVRGAHWPTVVLRPGASMVVVAGHGAEWESPAAAIAACGALSADCVLSNDDVGLAEPLALALAERRGRPLLIIRGTSRPLGADVLLLGAPDLGGELPAWLAPLQGLLNGRLSMALHPPSDPELGALRAFPIDAGRVSPTALMWCSRTARRMLGGADQRWWSEGAIPDLVRRRGVDVLRTDALAWIAGGQGAPSAEALEAAETLVKTADVAQLRSRMGPARLSLLIDARRDLVGFAVEQGIRRALVLAGMGRHQRTVWRANVEAKIGNVPSHGSLPLGSAMLSGVRTLLAREAPQ